MLTRYPVKVDLHMVTPEELKAESRRGLNYLNTLRWHGVTLYRRAKSEK
jgi:hypothetical protein